MTIHPIGPSSFLLYMTFADLQERSMHPEFLTHEHTLELAREGLSSLGRLADSAVELESYPDKNGLLLFIHTTLPVQSVWRFMNCDAFMDALLTAPELADCSTYWWNESFWLISDDPCDTRLSEFADSIEDDPLLPARLNEYAIPILPAT